METTTKTKQQSVLRLLAALFFLCLFAPMAAGQDNWKDHCATQIANKDGGNGTSWDNAIVIATAEELAYFAQQVNNNASITHKGGASIKIMALKTTISPSPPTSTCRIMIGRR